MLHLLILLCLLATCSCSIRSAPRYTADSKVERELKERRRASPNRLARVVEGYLGVPYKWGGNTRAGMDCSAFVRDHFPQDVWHRIASHLQADIPRRPHRQPTAGPQTRRSGFFQEYLLRGGRLPRWDLPRQEALRPCGREHRRAPLPRSTTRISSPAMSALGASSAKQLSEIVRRHSIRS